MHQSLLRRGPAVLALGATALLAAGCGSSTRSAAAPTGQSTVGSSVIARAASVSGAAKGERIAYSLTEKAPSIGQILVTGTGAFNNSPAQGALTLHVDAPGAAGLSTALSNLQLQLAIDSKTLYLKLPSSLAALAGSFTHGKPWLSLNLANVAKSANVPGLSSLLNGAGTTTNPMAELKQFEAASSDGVTKVGTPTVNGVATTEYQGQLDLAKLADHLPASIKANAAAVLAQAQKTLGKVKIPFTIDIDSANLVRRLVLQIPTPSTDGTSASSTGKLQLDFLAYGTQPAPSLPAAGDTYSLDSLVSQYANKARSGSATAGGFFGG